jgi:hypothetical protein
MLHNIYNICILHNVRKAIIQIRERLPGNQISSLGSLRSLLLVTDRTSFVEQTKGEEPD